jgi:hypothetical protein
VVVSYKVATDNGRNFYVNKSSFLSLISIVN